MATLFQLPAGCVVSITTAHLSCCVCGRELEEVEYRAWPTDEYRTVGGVRRRQFIPFSLLPCGCRANIWLSDDAPEAPRA